ERGGPSTSPPRPGSARRPRARPPRAPSPGSPVPLAGADHDERRAVLGLTPELEAPATAVDALDHGLVASRTRDRRRIRAGRPEPHDRTCGGREADHPHRHRAEPPRPYPTRVDPRGRSLDGRPDPRQVETVDVGPGAALHGVPEGREPAHRLVTSWTPAGGP